MANYSAGSASVDIKPNFGGFVTQLRAELNAVIANLPVDVVPDTATFAADLATELAKINAALGVEIQLAGQGRAPAARLAALSRHHVRAAALARIAAIERRHRDRGGRVGGERGARRGDGRHW